MKREDRLRRTRFAAGLLVLTVLFSFVSTSSAENRVRLQSSPKSFVVVPGEPIQVHLTIRSDSAAKVRVNVPKVPLLHLRAIEKLPVRRTREGVVVYRRVIVWQGLEPGTVKLRDLAVVIDGQKLQFPEISITVRDPQP